MKEEQQTTNVTERKESDIIKDTIQGVKDAASLELMKPIITRVRNRLKTIQEQSQAKHVKIKRGNQSIWHTEKPNIHISNLSSRIENGIGTITYYVYESDKHGDKKMHKNERDYFDENTGEKKKRLISSEYVYEKLVIETIQYLKPIKTEITKMGE